MKYKVGDKIKFSQNVSSLFSDYPFVHTEDEFKIVSYDGMKMLLCIKASGESVVSEGQRYGYEDNVIPLFIRCDDIQLEFDF